MGLASFNRARRQAAEKAAKEALRAEQKAKEEEAEELFVCDICGKEYRRESAYLKHLEKHQESPEELQEADVND